MARMSRAVVMAGLDFEVREYPVPEPAPGTTLSRPEMSGICASDVHAWEHQRLSGAVLLGHENVGVIEALGDGVTSDSNGRPLAIGDRVIFAPGTPPYGYGYCQADQPPHLHGGYADYIYLAHPESCILKTNLPPEIAVLTEPFTIGVHAVMRAGITFGDTVVVRGSGAIGLLTLVCAKLSGAGRLIIVGGPAGRLELAHELGADVAININDVRDPAERTKLVLDETVRGAGADVVFECPGFLSALPEGIGYLRRSGTYVEVGLAVDVGSLELNPSHLLVRKNLRLEAVMASNAEHFRRAMPILEKRDFPFEQLVSHVLPFERAADGFHALAGTDRLDDRDVIKIVLQSALR